MNLGMDFRGGLERLPSLLENLVARINTVWKKQHNPADGTHTDVTAEDVAISGSLRVGSYPGPGIWSSGSLPMPQPVFGVVPPPFAPGIEHEIGALSLSNIRVHSDAILTLEGSLIGIQSESTAAPNAPGASIQLGGVPSVVILSEANITLTASPAVDLTNGQLKFPASQNASANANTLDDYQEESWDPVVNFGGAAVGQTYTARTATYTKIGNQVTVACYLQLLTKGSSTGNASIGGLPGALYFPVPVVAAMVTSGVGLCLLIVSGTGLTLYTTGVGNITDADFADTTFLYFTFTGIVS